MAFQRVPNTVSIRIVCVASDEEVGNYYYAQKSGGYSQSDINSLATTIDAAAGGQYAALMATNDEYVRTDIQGLDSENDISATNNNSATAGSIAYYDAPANVSFVVSQLSGLSGRSARGRVYLPPLPRFVIEEGASGSDQMKTAYADAWVVVVDGIRSAIAGTGVWNPVLVSRFHDGSKRTEAVVFNWTTTLYNTRTLATRRSRLR